MELKTLHRSSSPTKDKQILSAELLIRDAQRTINNHTLEDLLPLVEDISTDSDATIPYPDPNYFNPEYEYLLEGAADEEVPLSTGCSHDKKKKVKKRAYGKEPGLYCRRSRRLAGSPPTNERRSLRLMQRNRRR